jgi:hypothetical protein
VVATLASLFAYTTRQGWTPTSPASGLERGRYGRRWIWNGRHALSWPVASWAAGSLRRDRDLPGSDSDRDRPAGGVGGGADRGHRARVFVGDVGGLAVWRDRNAKGTVPFDFAEPALTLGFDDAGGEVVADLG